MNIDIKLSDLIDRIQSGYQPTEKDCAYMLQFPETSFESALIRSSADCLSRMKYHNNAVMLGQIGFEIAPCPGRCKFCSFSEEHTAFSPSSMSDEELLRDAHAFTDSGELFALFLMAMHNTSFERILHVVELARKEVNPKTQIVVNIGDFGKTQAAELKAAGAGGAYHVLRLREGTDTALPPEQRRRSLSYIKAAGLSLYYCCEPIGPEHTPEEIAEQMMTGLEYECFQHAAMRRVYLPSSPLARFGQITELRLAQICAVVTLLCHNSQATRSIAIHEPNLLGLTAGANSIYAEAGANPRDTESDTTGHRGKDTNDCKRMFYEAGFAHLLCSPDHTVSLADAYK